MGTYQRKGRQWIIAVSLTATERDYAIGKLIWNFGDGFYALVIDRLLKRAFCLYFKTVLVAWGCADEWSNTEQRMQSLLRISAQANALFRLLSLTYSSDWIALVNESPVKFLHHPSQFTSSINKIPFSLVGRMCEGLFSSSTSHKPADHPVLHDAYDWNAPINQQRGYWIYPGCTDSRGKRRRCQKAFSWSDRSLQR